MGFYATESTCDRPQETYLPPKNRVGGFSATSPTHAPPFASQPLETHWENEPTPTTTASGVSFYGYRYYAPQVGRWLSRDPIDDAAFVNSVFESDNDLSFIPNTYSALMNSPNNFYDYLGLDCVTTKTKEGRPNKKCEPRPSRRVIKPRASLEGTRCTCECEIWEILRQYCITTQTYKYVKKCKFIDPCFPNNPIVSSETWTNDEVISEGEETKGPPLARGTVPGGSWNVLSIRECSEKCYRACSGK
jgi:RHS repeat-associated protein